jgi:hypothetical protein
MFDHASQRIAQVHAELHPERPDLHLTQDSTDGQCVKIISGAVQKRAMQICDANARASMGRPFQDDLHQADRELAPVLEVFVAQFFASQEPKTEADPYKQDEANANRPQPARGINPVPDKARAAAAILCTGTREQKEEAFEWVLEKDKPIAFYCEKLHQCKWQGFKLHQGLGWGAVPGENDPWRVWHDKECGGKLIELYDAFCAQYLVELAKHVFSNMPQEAVRTCAFPALVKFKDLTGVKTI